MLRVLRESFAAKLFAGLLGTVGLLMLVTYGVVQSVTATQVQQASERATQNAATQFTKLDSIRLQLAARVARPLTQAPRIHALLDEAVETGDLSLLAGEVVYQVDLFQLDDVLVAFTDTRGRPVLTLHGSVAMEGADPAGVTPIAERVLSGEAMEGRSYRVLDGELFSIRTTLIQVGGRAIGTLSVGLVVPDEEVTEAGAVRGVEVCLVVEGSCTAGTARSREALDLFMDHMGEHRRSPGARSGSLPPDQGGAPPGRRLRPGPLRGGGRGVEPGAHAPGPRPGGRHRAGGGGGL